MHLEIGHIWGAIVSFILAVLGWREVDRRDKDGMMKKAIEDAAKDADEARRALEAHKLYAAETFARKGDVDRLISQMEARLKQQLAEQGAKQLDVLEEIRDRLPARH